MNASQMLSVIQGASNKEWATRFVPYANSVGLNYDARIDLTTACESDIHAAIIATHPHRASRCHNSYRSRVANMLLNAVKHLVVGSIVAIKKGKSIQMFVRITGSYHYEPDHPSGNPHRWTYTHIRDAAPSEQHYENCSIYDAFEYNKVPLPADLVPVPPPSSSNAAPDPETEAISTTNTLLRRIADLEAALAAANTRNAELEARLAAPTTIIIRGGVVSISTA